MALLQRLYRLNNSERQKKKTLHSVKFRPFSHTSISLYLVRMIQVVALSPQIITKTHSKTCSDPANFFRVVSFVMPVPQLRV